jgi:hypothetical protein
MRPFASSRRLLATLKRLEYTAWTRRTLRYPVPGCFQRQFALGYNIKLPGQAGMCNCKVDSERVNLVAGD